MSVELTRITVGGGVLPQVSAGTSAIEVRESVDAATVFAFRFDLIKGHDGWPFLDDPPLQPWHRATIEAGFSTDPDLLVDGYITDVDARLRTDGSGSLEVSGLDRSVALDLEDRRRTWPGRTDSQIAEQIFRDAHLEPVTDPVEGASDEQVSVTAQSDTDMRFLRHLARRNGFECFVRGSTGFFRAPNLAEPPQPLLALGLGARTNLVETRVQVDGKVPQRVDARRIDPFGKQIEADSLSSLPGPPLGRDGVAAFPAPGSTGHRGLRAQPAATRATTRARLAGAYRPTARFVTLTGTVDGRIYSTVLRCGRTVTVTGLGDRHSGLYYVTQVNHLFTAAGYTQRFTAHRDGTGLTGREHFAGPGP